MLCFALLIPWSGCTTSTQGPESAESSNRDVARVTPAGYRTQELNLGPVLAHGQVLRHEFALTNPSDRPIRLLKASSSFPCCSSIGPLPGTIPPRGEVKVPVVVKTENRSGPLHIGFAVATDSIAAPIRHLGIAVRLIPEWQIEDKEAPTDPLALSEPGKRIYRIACRRMETGGLGLPDSMTVGGPMTAALMGEAQETTISGGIIEATREVAVDLLPASQAGRRHGEILFRWSNGLTRSHVATWEVVRSVNVSPSGLVIRRSKEPAPVTIVVTSEGRDIRILKVDGPLVKMLSLPTDSSRMHRLGLMVDTLNVRSGDVSDITITTDHPDQSSVAVTLLFSASSNGGER
jgi:hypothetical protein